MKTINSLGLRNKSNDKNFFFKHVKMFLIYSPGLNKTNILQVCLANTGGTISGVPFLNFSPYILNVV